MKSSVRLKSLHRDHAKSPTRVASDTAERSRHINAFFQNIGTELRGKWREITIITAYLDVKILWELLDAINGNKHRDPLGNQTTGCRIKIYADAAATTKLIQSAKTPAALFKKFAANKVELHAVRLGALFHAKGVVIKTADQTWSSVGSLNFTSKGHADNEELFACEVGECLAGGKPRGLAKELLDYVDYLIETGRCEKLFKAEVKARRAYDLRSFFLDGELWWEMPETSLFAVSMGFPSAVKNSDALKSPAVSPLLKNTAPNAIDIRDVLRLNVAEDGPKKLRWKRKYCIQTCLGLWSPKSWHEQIELATQSSSGGRNSVIKELEKAINKGAPGAATQALSSAISGVWRDIVAKDAALVEYVPTNEAICQRAEKWIRRTTMRLADGDYMKRLSNNANDTVMPDLWAGSPSDQDDFEESYFRSLQYEFDRIQTVNRHRSLQQKACLDGVAPNALSDDDEWGELRAKFVKSIDGIVRAINEETGEIDDGEYEDWD